MMFHPVGMTCTVAAAKAAPVIAGTQADLVRNWSMVIAAKKHSITTSIP